MTVPSMRITVIVATAALAACSDPRAECKDSPHSVSVEVPLSSPIDITKDPQVDATKAKARSKWADEVTTKFGPEWAKWDKTKSSSQECGAPANKQMLICIAKATACKTR